MRAWSLALVGLAVLAAGPADAAKKRDAAPQRNAATAPRAAVAAPARAHGVVLPSLVGRAHASTGRAATAPAPAATARTRTVALGVEPAAPLRGRLAGTSSRHAAVSTPAACHGKAGRRAGACRERKLHWMSGLPPAAGVQAQECPDGTMATPARGHENIIRCMPI